MHQISKKNPRLKGLRNKTTPRETCDANRTENRDTSGTSNKIPTKNDHTKENELYQTIKATIFFHMMLEMQGLVK